MHDAAAYRDQLAQLLPRGAAWTLGDGSSLEMLLFGIAEEFARLDGRAMGLQDEADPLSALELLPDWERVAGLPDNCIPIPESIRDRQVAVARKISGLGGQSRAFFVDQAERLGVEVTIEEFRQFRAGRSHAGDRCYGTDWRFVWRMRILPPSESSNDPERLRFTYFRAGRSRAGDRLRAGGISTLECIIRRFSPAHTTVLFSYPVEPEPVLWFDFLTSSGG